MSHRGTRSLRGKLKQAIRHYILTTSFQDPILAESICRVNREELLGYASVLIKQLEVTNSIPDLDTSITVGDVPDVEKGLVLSDSRGRGVFQK
jgi:hypothetical protein